MRLKKVKWSSSNNNSALHILVSNLSSSQLVIWRWRPCEGGLVTEHSPLWDFISYYITYYIIYIIQGDFLTGPPDFQYQNEKTCSANEELFYIENFVKN